MSDSSIEQRVRQIAQRRGLVPDELLDHWQETEAHLHEREARLEGLAHSIPGVVYQFVARPDGTYGLYFVSEHAEPVLGLDPDPEDFYERFVGQVPESHREALIQSVDEAVEEERKWSFEMPFEKPTGERLWIKGISMPDRRDGELLFNGVLLDITTRKRREQALRRTERQFEAIFEDPNMLVGLVDLEGRLQEVNQTALSYIDAGREQVLGELFWETPWFPPSRRGDVREWIRQAASGEYVDFEIPLAGSGSEHFVEGTIRPVRNEDGEVVSLVISDRDVTDRKTYEQQLIEARNQARQASRMKSALLENMSHELRTPLASVIGFADLMLGEAEEPISGFAERIRENGQRLLDTLEAVLNLAELEGEDVSVEPRQIDAGEIVRQAAETHEPKAQRKGLCLLTGEVPRECRAITDPSVLSRITTHLVSNGIKFTKDGSVSVALVATEDELVLDVIDTGIGISEEARQEIFDPFFQASSGLAREYEGTGLGLTITRRLAELAGGTIEVKDSDSGTHAQVRLPRDLSERDEYEPTSPAHAWGLDQLPGSQQVLLVEDDAAMRELVRAMLPEEIQLVEAAGPQEALDQVTEHVFDLILLDINLKAQINGVELLGRMREEFESPGPLIIAVTAYATAGDEEAFHEAGFDGYVAKPFTKETLRKNLIQVVESARSNGTSAEGGA